MVRGMGAHRERQAMAIHNRHDFQALSAPRRTDFRAAALGYHKGCVDEALFFVERAVLAKFVGDVSQNTPQHFIVAPVLKAPMHGLIVRIALRQHVPLSTRVSKSTEPLPELGASEQASDPVAHQQCAPPESVSGCIPTARPSA